MTGSFSRNSVGSYILCILLYLFGTYWIIKMQAEYGDLSDLKMAHLVAARNKCRRHTLANVR